MKNKKIIIKFTKEEIKLFDSEILDNPLSGLVSVYDLEKKKYIGEWHIEVSFAKILHYPLMDKKELPQCYNEIEREVNMLIRTYYDGLIKRGYTHGNI